MREYPKVTRSKVTLPMEDIKPHIIQTTLLPTFYVAVDCIELEPRCISHYTTQPVLASIRSQELHDFNYNVMLIATKLYSTFNVSNSTRDLRRKNI